MARCVLFPYYPIYKVQSSFQVCYLHLESVAVKSQYEIQRAVTITKASHHWLDDRKNSFPGE